MGNAQSGGCFPKKEKDLKKSEDEYAEEPPAAADDEEQLESLDETEEEEAQAVEENSGASPAPPLVMVDIKEADKRSVQAADKQVRNEWYEFGVDEKVCEILRTCEMEHYIPNFAFHQIDFQTLAYLTVDDLKDMNVNRVGHRRKLLMKFHSIPADTRKATKSR
mmetsp:Transcript_7915/g.21527  ORF Transcript_7915/g.21527 Transcript_7915/m.21527 type:complete len:164 (+) Transcript_7915:104-595(+)